MFARERMCDGTAAAVGAQGPERRWWRWQSGGRETKWLGADTLLGDAGVAIDAWAITEHHRHPGSGRARRPCHGPTTRSVTPVVVSHLRAVPEAPRGPPPRSGHAACAAPLLLTSLQRKRIADAQSTTPSSCMSTIDSVLASDALDASAMGDLGKLSTCLNFLPPPRPINDFWRGSCISDQSPLAPTILPPVTGWKGLGSEESPTVAHHHPGVVDVMPRRKWGKRERVDRMRSEIY